MKKIVKMNRLNNLVKAHKVVLFTQFPQKGSIVFSIACTVKILLFWNKFCRPKKERGPVFKYLLINIKVLNVGIKPTLLIDILTIWYKEVNKDTVRVGKERFLTRCVKAILAIAWMGLENKVKNISL